MEKQGFFNVILGGCSGANKNNNNNNKNNNNATTITKKQQQQKQQQQQQQQQKQQQRNNNNKKQQQQQKQQPQPQQHQQQHTENNNHTNKNKTKNNHTKKNNRTKTRPRKNKKKTKNEPSCLQIAHGSKIGPKIMHPPQAPLNTKISIPEARNTKFCKMYNDGISYTHKYFQIGTCAQPHNVTSKNTIFIRAAPRQTGIALDHPVQKFMCVFPQN